MYKRQLRIWQPRQTASTGRPTSSAADRSARSLSSRIALTPATSGSRVSPYAAGSTSPPPVSTRPSTAAITAAAPEPGPPAALRGGGSSTGRPPAAATSS